MQGLDALYDDLHTMSTLVYECHVDCGVTFDSVRRMSAIERLQLMMDRVFVCNNTTESSSSSIE